VALSLDLAQNIHAVVVAQSSRHLVVVHGKVVFLDTPQFGQTGRVDNLEDAGVTALPGNVAGVPLCGVIEQLLQKVPQKATI